MSKVSKILDQYLFAPGRHLDVEGNIVGARAAKNILSKPETKIGALTGLSLALTFAAADQRDLAQFTFGTATIFTCASLISKKKSSLPYFDTAPEKKEPLPPLIEAYLHQRRIVILLSTAVYAPLPSVLGGAFYYAGMDTKHAAVFTALGTASLATSYTADWWRTSRTLNSGSPNSSSATRSNVRPCRVQQPSASARPKRVATVPSTRLSTSSGVAQVANADSRSARLPSQRIESCAQERISVV